jgi:hypothetical protein
MPVDMSAVGAGNLFLLSRNASWLAISLAPRKNKIKSQASFMTHASAV